MTSGFDRMAGCLKGIAIGDALGKQTETLSRENVQRWYPDGVRGFEGVPDAVPAADNEAGTSMALANLARLLEEAT